MSTFHALEPAAFRASDSQPPESLDDVTGWLGAKGHQPANLAAKNALSEHPTVFARFLRSSGCSRELVHSKSRSKHWDLKEIVGKCFLESFVLFRLDPRILISD